MERLLEPGRDHSILEVGCGSGFYTSWLAGRSREFEAIDACEEMVQACRGLGISAQCSSLEAWSSSRKFQRILAAGVLEFAQDPAEFLRAAERRLEPGGRLVLLVPHAGWRGWIYSWWHILLGCPARAISLRELRRLASIAGLVIEAREAAGPVSCGISLAAERNMHFSERLAVEYWNRRIRDWENSRYGTFAALKPNSFAVFHRLRQAQRLLNKESQDSVLDIGCGSGLLATGLRPGREMTYIGFDSSSEAIESAKARRFPARVRAEFRVCDASETELPATTVTVALGLVDWLSDRQLAALFGKLRSQKLLLAFTEKRSGPFAFLYHAYHGRKKSMGIRYPREFSLEEILAFPAKQGYRLVKQRRNCALGLGVLLELEKR